MCTIMEEFIDILALVVGIAWFGPVLFNKMFRPEKYHGLGKDE